MSNTIYIPTFIMMYGYTASGKTTHAKNFLKYAQTYGVEEQKQIVYISADEIRKKLYGSQDIYGDGLEIYGVAIARVLNALEQGKDVIYDACNLYRSYRMDFLNPIEDSGIECKKVIIRMNTDKETCIKRHKKRGRNFDINKAMNGFNINEPPKMDEGWDSIKDETFTEHSLSFYIASPFFEDIHRQRVYEVAEHFRNLGHRVFVPCEHKIDNAWDLPNYEWGKAVFNNDIEAINDCDYVICLNYGRISSAGTAWEVGYSYGIGKPVITVEMPGVNLMSIMISNGSFAVLKNLETLYNYDFYHPFPEKDYEMEQK